jgi:hypothetical protein
MLRAPSRKIVSSLSTWYVTLAYQKAFTDKSQHLGLLIALPSSGHLMVG